MSFPSPLFSETVCVCRRSVGTDAYVEGGRCRKITEQSREKTNIFLLTLDSLAESLQMEGIFHAAVLHTVLLTLIFL